MNYGTSRAPVKPQSGFECRACRRWFNWSALSGFDRQRRICETCVSRRGAPCSMCQIATLWRSTLIRLSDHETVRVCLSCAGSWYTANFSQREQLADLILTPRRMGATWPTTLDQMKQHEKGHQDVGTNSTSK